MRLTPREVDEAPARDAVAVDGHVHFRPGFSLKVFLGAAASNLSAALPESQHSTIGPNALFLAESADHDYFHEWEHAARVSPRTDWRWTIRTTPEEETLLVIDEGVPRLWIIAGRQIATDDGLEVLALGTRERFREGLDLARTLDAVRRADALAVVPWGFGKFWFRRGRRVENLLRLSDSEGLYLGDTGNRYRHLLVPRQFKLAARQGVRILPGSDPLPIASEARHAGSCGFLLCGEIDPHRPAASLKALLRHPATPLLPYGNGPSLARFLRHQLGMQWRKLRRRSSRDST